MPSALWAQARVTGIVTDTTGAVAAGATVTARNVATGQITPAETNQSGIYAGAGDGRGHIAQEDCAKNIVGEHSCTLTPAYVLTMRFAFSRTFFP